MSNSHTLMPDMTSVSMTTGADEKPIVRHKTTEYKFSTESCRAENDVQEVPVNDLIETANKYRTQGPSAFKTHEQLKQELFGD